MIHLLKMKMIKIGMDTERITKYRESKRMLMASIFTVESFTPIIKIMITMVTLMSNSKFFLIVPLSRGNLLLITYPITRPITSGMRIFMPHIWIIM